MIGTVPTESNLDLVEGFNRWLTIQNYSESTRVNYCTDVRGLACFAARSSLLEIERHVSVVHCALGDRSDEADLFLVEGRHDWFNSLRPPVVEERTCRVRVEVRRLDDVLAELGISQVDFIKLDVEGAKLSFLRGATRLLQSESRPAILAEVQDLRTQAWGYAAREIIEFLVRANYRWFALTADSHPRPASTDLPSYDANLVALPQERVEEFQRLLTVSETSWEEIGMAGQP